MKVKKIVIFNITCSEQVIFGSNILLRDERINTGISSKISRIELLMFQMLLMLIQIMIILIQLVDNGYLNMTLALSKEMLGYVRGKYC